MGEQCPQWAEHQECPGPGHRAPAAPPVGDQLGRAGHQAGHQHQQGGERPGQQVAALQEQQRRQGVRALGNWCFLSSPSHCTHSLLRHTFACAAHDVSKNTFTLNALRCA